VVRCDGEGPRRGESACLDDCAALVGEAGEAFLVGREGSGREQGVEDGGVGDVEFPAGGVLGDGDGGDDGADVVCGFEEAAPAGDQRGREEFGQEVDEDQDYFVVLDVFAVVRAREEAVGDGLTVGGVLDEVVAFGKGVFVDDVVGEGRERVEDVDWFLVGGFAVGMETGEQGVDALFDDGLEVSHALGREKGVDSRPAEFVQVVVDSAESAEVGGELLGVESPAIAASVPGAEQLREELRVADVHLFGVDTDDRPVLLVQLDHLEDILASEDDVVVELIPPRQSSESRARDVRDGAEVETPYRPVQRVYCQQSDEAHDMDGRQRCGEIDDGHG